VFVLAATDVCLAAETIAITIRSLSFDPKQVEARVGDTVMWTNNSLTNHTATSDDDAKAFDTRELKPDETSKPVKLASQGNATTTAKFTAEL
jgi:plastocyanin